ncbi:MAG: hypothetical protein ACYDA8_20175 [Deferrisomatales bacterium]
MGGERRNEGGGWGWGDFFTGVAIGWLLAPRPQERRLGSADPAYRAAASASDGDGPIRCLFFLCWAVAAAGCWWGVPETGFLPSLFVGLVAAFPLTLLAVVAISPLPILWELLQVVYDLLRLGAACVKSLGPRWCTLLDSLRERLDAERAAARERPRPPRLRPPLRSVPGSGRFAGAVNGLGPVARLVLFVAPWLTLLGFAAIFSDDPAEAWIRSPPLSALVLLVSLGLWLAAVLVLLRLAWCIAFPQRHPPPAGRGEVLRDADGQVPR